MNTFLLIGTALNPIYIDCGDETLTAESETSVHEILGNINGLRRVLEEENYILNNNSNISEEDNDMVHKKRKSFDEGLFGRSSAPPPNKRIKKFCIDCNTVSTTLWR